MELDILEIVFKTIKAFSPRANKILRRNKGGVVFLFAAFLFAASLRIEASGKTFAEYRKNVKDAETLTLTLIYSDEDEMSPTDLAKYERKALAQIRADLPAREKIVWRNTEIETDNRWLVDKLSEFEKESSDEAQRRAILTEVSERLEAVEQKLNEAESPPAGGARAKDENKQKLAEILRREEYLKPEKPKESFFQKLWRKIKEWLFGNLPKPDLSSPQQTNQIQTLSFVLQMLLYAVILGVIAFLIRRFAPFFAQKFKSRERRQTAERVILGERIAEGETAENLFGEAERMARSGDLRGAIRKGYVALLCDLSDRRLVRLARHKTNRDYLRDVRGGKAEIYENVNNLTGSFERYWYGAEAVEEKDWDEFKDQYIRAIKN